MTFVSWQFGIFVAAVFGAYYSPPFRNFQVQLLVVASLFFYGYGQPELLPLLLVAVLGTYAFLVLAFRNRAIWMPAGIAFNLARNWVHWGHAASAGIDVIVVWAHHVGLITGRAPDGTWIVKSGNDGHAVRERARSIGGAIAFRTS